MAAISTIIAAASLAIGAASAVASHQQGKKAARAQAAAGREQKAAAAQQAAQERRQQIREERVRRARILQSGENTGTAGSSVEAGAIGGMGTGLSSNIGFNLGQITSASRVGDLLQTAANYNTRSQGYAALSSFATSNAGTLGRIAGNIFDKPPAGTTPQAWNVDYQATRDR